MVLCIYFFSPFQKNIAEELWYMYKGGCIANSDIIKDKKRLEIINSATCTKAFLLGKRRGKSIKYPHRSGQRPSPFPPPPWSVIEVTLGDFVCVCVCAWNTSVFRVTCNALYNSSLLEYCINSKTPNAMEEVLFLRPTIPPKCFDMLFPLTEGCSEGLARYVQMFLLDTIKISVL